MQAEKDSLTKQQEQAIKYCVFKGYHIYKTIKEVGSGRRKDNREGFQALEEEIEKNSFDILIFYELSRLARNQYLLHSLINSLNNKMISFESITENYLNSDSPTSKMMLGFLASMAEIESDMTSKRVRNRMRHYASEGYWVFPPPRGYTLKDKILYEDKEAAELVRKIFEEFLKGATLRELQRRYSLSSPGLKNLLTNVAYIGNTKFGFAGRNKAGKRVNNLPGEVFEGRHESIIDIRDFELAQAMLQTKKDTYNTQIKNNKYLLTGLLRHSCGYAGNGKRGNRGYDHYRCRECHGAISLIKLEKLVVKEFKSYIKNLKFLKNNRKKKNNVHETLKVLKEKKLRASDIYIEGAIDRNEYLKRIGNIDGEINTIKKGVKDREEPKRKFSNYDKLLGLIKGFDDMDIEEKNRILKLFIDKIIYHDNESDIDIIFKI